MRKSTKNAYRSCFRAGRKTAKELNLKDYQLFLVDSVLQRNFTDLMKEVESMRVAGIQTRESYKSVQEKWTKKTDNALEKIDKEQFIKYLEMVVSIRLTRKTAEKEKQQ